MDPDALAQAATRYADPGELAALTAATEARLQWRARRGFKVCETCHEAKRVTAFGQHSRNRDGLRRACRACRSTSE